MLLLLPVALSLCAFQPQRGSPPAPPCASMASRLSGGVQMLSSLLSGGAVGKREINYNSLSGRPKSFAKECGGYALQGEVPLKSADGYEVATFAAGCFWGTELHFQRIPGVIATCVGYTQGTEERPTYAQVSSGKSGHTEGIQLIFDPKHCSYATLCDKLLALVDPTVQNRVGGDSGTQYRHGIYPHGAAQMEVARERVGGLQRRLSRKILTELKPAAIFWPAEEYHQRYLEKGGRFGRPQSADKGAEEEVRCYG